MRLKLTSINHPLLPGMLLFLFSVLALSVRHWLSTIFALIVLLALFFAWRQKDKLHREEKVLIGIFVVYFISFVISGTLAGWNYGPFHRLGNEFKFILFIPLYLYIRKMPEAWKWLLLSIPFAGAVLGLQAIYDVSLGGYKTGNGIYGPIIFGDLSLLLMVFTIILLSQCRSAVERRCYFYVASIFLSALATLLSMSRNAWLGVIVLIPLFFILHGRKPDIRILSISVATILGVLLLAYSLMPQQINARAGLALNNIRIYFDKTAPGRDKVFETSAGTRLELWRASLYIFSENKFFGVGPGNTGIAINKLVDEHIIHPALYRKDAGTQAIHAHSLYFEMLAAQGIAGFASAIVLLGYLIYFFWKNRSANRVIAAFGLIHIISFSIFSLTEVPFIHDNFTAFFLVYLAVFFAWLTREKYLDKPA